MEQDPLLIGKGYDLTEYLVSTFDSPCPRTSDTHIVRAGDGTPLVCMFRRAFPGGPVVEVALPDAGSETDHRPPHQWISLDQAKETAEALMALYNEFNYEVPRA